MIIDGFAGPGGWDEGLRMLGHDDVLGIEWDKAACLTARAAGHKRLHLDIAKPDLIDRIRHLIAPTVEGVIMSPPCQAWSMAGKRKGELDRANCHTLADRMASGDDSTDWTIWEDDRSPLVCQPVRWVRELRPEWVALEEVPAVASLWEHFARIYQAWGYRVWTGDLCAADYGIVSACPIHETFPPENTAEYAERLSQYATHLAIAEAVVTTSRDDKAANLVATVAARLGRAISQAFAGSATPGERARALAALAASVDPKTPLGPEAATWTTRATSRFGLTPDTVENISSLLSSFLGDDSTAEKWSTMSMATRLTIVQRISKCIAATLTTGCNTGRMPQARPAGCGLCVDVAVPQTRTRRILIAHRNRKVGPPPPTHSETAHGNDLFGGQTQPWVSMAEALGWGFEDQPSCTVSGGGTEAGGAEPFANAAYRKRLAEVVGRQWSVQPGERPPVYVNGNQPNAGRRSIDEPAPTVMFGHRSNDVRWVHERPATTVVGSYCPDVIAAPGSVRVTVQEAGVLQSFPREYPWQGSRTKQFEQVGNAIPPLLAAHVLAALGVGQLAQEHAA